MRSLLVLALALVGSGSRQQDRPGPVGPEDPARAALAAALAESGVLLDFAAGAAAIDVGVLVKEDLLEYLLVGSGGAGHESLFQTAVQPSLLNAGMLALGVTPGVNAIWERVDPPPSLEERRAGRKPFSIRKPTGDGFYLYAAWREGDDVFLYRVEDLVANLKTGRAMQRHRWVYLGSAFLPSKDPSEPPLFAADAEGNVINLAYFQSGHTLLTAALDDCEDQSIWIANPWLLPARGATVRLVFAREPLAALPAAWAESLPVVVPGDEEGDGAGDAAGERDDG
jgi:hypothetical protein